MKKPSKTTTKIIAAMSVTIFSIFAFVVGTFAWFSGLMKYESNEEDFEVTLLGDCQLEDVALYKFIYPPSLIGTGYDYLAPERGNVMRFTYNFTEGSFGYYKDVDQTEWVAIDIMNVYDPLERVIDPTKELRTMNCNVIYELHLYSPSLANASLTSSVFINENRTKEDSQIYLSTCTDYDLFLPTELADDNPSFYDSTNDDYKAYYPSYKKHNVELTDLEKTYHKISLLSDLLTSHPHFYGSDDNPIPLRNTNVTFDDEGKLVVFVNVNYAPSELAQYQKDIYFHNITAVMDIYFQLAFGGA